MAKKKPRKKKSSKRVTTKKKKPATPKRRPVKRSSGTSSVDVLLKRFAKERSVKESQLNSLRAKKSEIEERVRKHREQIAKLAEQETKAVDEMAQLDARRDREVAQLLAKLGVRLGTSATHASGNDSRAQKSSGNVKPNRDRAAGSLASSRDNLN